MHVYLHGWTEGCMANTNFYNYISDIINIADQFLVCGDSGLVV